MKNQREVKFRGWHTKNKEWLHYTLHDLLFNGLVQPNDFDKWCEFTGLQDTEGRDIYEGDILQHKKGDGELGKLKGVVNFARGAFRVTRRKEDPMSSVAGRAEQNVWTFSKHHVVVGNVYENSDLIL